MRKNRRHAKKVTQPAQAEQATPLDQADAAPPPYRPCRVWWAYRDNRGHFVTDLPEALLLTEPDDLHGLIAFVPIGDGKPLDLNDAAQLKAWRAAVGVATDRAGQILHRPGMFDDAHPTTFEAIDLRDVGRWWSHHATPPWLYDVRVRPAEGTLVGECWHGGTRLDPFCPIRFAKELEKFTALRWPKIHRPAMPYNFVGIAETRDDDGDDIGEGGFRSCVVRRVDDYPYQLGPGVGAKMAEAKAIVVAQALTLTPPWLVGRDLKAA